MSTRNVVINGITVGMYRKDDGDTIRPLRVDLNYAKVHPDVFGLSAADCAVAVAALQEAGVTTVPVYEDEARAAGVKWSEVAA